MSMNIVDAYVKFKGQLIVVISGIDGCGKKKVANKVCDWLKFPLIDQNKFYKENFKNEVELPNGEKETNWYTDDAVDWDKFNKEVSDHGRAIVIGLSFPDTKVAFKPDFHVHVSVPKKVCIDKRMETMREEESFNEQLELYRFNHFLYPFYMESTKNTRVNKFINAVKFEDIGDVASNTFDVIMELIDKELKRSDNGPLIISDMSSSVDRSADKSVDEKTITDGTPKEPEQKPERKPRQDHEPRQSSKKNKHEKDEYDSETNELSGLSTDEVHALSNTSDVALYGDDDSSDTGVPFANTYRFNHNPYQAEVLYGGNKDGRKYWTEVGNEMVKFFSKTYSTKNKMSAKERNKKISDYVRNVLFGKITDDKDVKKYYESRGKQNKALGSVSKEVDIELQRLMKMKFPEKDISVVPASNFSSGTNLLGEFDLDFNVLVKDLDSNIMPQISNILGLNGYALMDNKSRKQQWVHQKYMDSKGLNDRIEVDAKVKDMGKCDKVCKVHGYLNDTMDQEDKEKITYLKHVFKSTEKKANKFYKVLKVMHFQLGAYNVEPNFLLYDLLL